MPCSFVIKGLRHLGYWHEKVSLWMSKIEKSLPCPKLKKFALSKIEKSLACPKLKKVCPVQNWTKFALSMSLCYLKT